MGRAEASRVLGVAPDASAEDVRTAYRRLLRTHHPDLAGEASTAQAARVIAAYQVFADPSPVDPGPGVAAPGPPADPPPVPGHDAIPVAGPTMAVMNLLCEAADVLGDISHIDRTGGIIETIVTWEGWPPCSLLITLLQRGDQTLAHCTLESLTGPPGPPIEQVVGELHRILAALAE